jgi:hypothetical protein
MIKLPHVYRKITFYNMQLCIEHPNRKKKSNRVWPSSSWGLIAAGAPAELSAEAVLEKADARQW